jgi:hypothetical protein
MFTVFKRLLSAVTRTGPTIAFVNQTTVLSDDQVKTAMNALQIQLDRDVQPVWHVDATLYFVPAGQQPSPYAWVLYIMDTSDQAGALGYHELTTSGNPIGRVFAKDDLSYGLSWTITASHELLEMLLDPYVSNVAFNQETVTGGTLYAYELCDPVEDDSVGYVINGVQVSDFVFPAWFEGWRAPNSTHFDHHGAVNAPFTLAPGGYVSIFEVAPDTQGWTQKFAENGPGKRFLTKGPHSRLRRRSSRFG